MAAASRLQTGPAKLEDVTALVHELERDLESLSLDNGRRREILERLKIYGRDPIDADPIYSSNGIRVLVKQAFRPETSAEASREAQSCIANALLLRESTRDYLAEEKPWTSLIKRLTSSESIDQFLAARILFVMTYMNQGGLYQPILDNTDLANTINQALEQQAQRSNGNGKAVSATAMDDQAVTEMAKLIFNVTEFLPSSRVQFSPSIPRLLVIATRRKRAAPLDQPVSACLNALLNLDTSAADWTSHAYDNSTASSTLPSLITILNDSLTHYKDTELDTIVSPLIALFSKLYANAPDAAQTYLQQRLLPSEQDRTQVLGHSDSLPSRLLRLSNSPASQLLANAISQLLFELSDSDPDTFVRNVGLGYASGYLVSNGLPMPSQGAGSEAAADARAGAAFNPVTGQRLDQERQVEDLPPMTDEEKEREAERLFVLFERLKATGVMDVRNPVEDAHRFEELPD